MSDDTFLCEQCGEVHAGLPTDWGFKKPDDIQSLSYIDEYLRARSNIDLATLNESRYFIRGVLSLPFQHKDGYFGWGIWVEVSKENHDQYVANFFNDASNFPRFDGKIANALPGYLSTRGVLVSVQLGNSTQRPTFWIVPESSHELGREQEMGISAQRHHEMLRACGFLDASS
jgi:hypothetical protein